LLNVIRPPFQPIRLIGFVCFFLSAHVSVTSQMAVAQENASSAVQEVPLFRHVDPQKKDPDFKAYKAIRFAVVDDFPPFSYRTGNGALTGFSVSIASASCKVLRIECVFTVKSFDLAEKAVLTGQADAMITGLRETAKTVETLTFTRPYYRFSAHFAVRQSTALKGNDVRSLAGKRLGVLVGTHHARFLNEHFSRSKIRQFDDRNEAYEALRTGAIDALFADSLKLMFWIKGSKSKGCCKFVGDAYIDPQTFSQPMAIAVKRNNIKLRTLLDHALDRLQVSGRFVKIYNQYFPLNP